MTRRRKAEKGDAMELIKWMLVFLAADVVAIVLTAKKEARRRMETPLDEAEEEPVDGPAIAEGLLPGSTVRCQDLNAMCAVRYLLQREGVETVWDDEDIGKGIYNLYVTKVGDVDAD